MLNQQEVAQSIPKFTDYLHGRSLQEAVEQLEQELKKQPAAVGKRFFLFQLMVVMGQW